HKEPDKTAPIIYKIKIINKEVNPGDTLKLRIEASDTESGFDEKTSCSLNLYNGHNVITLVRAKYNINTGNFEVEYTIPSNMKSGNWWISSISLYDKAGNYKYCENTDSTKYNFNVEYSFIGTENKVIKKGEEFDTLKGVIFSNNLEGDLTNKLEYYGQVNINKEGLYLIKYLVKG
ncbi:DUF5011 domain-containing protein, partial [Clostridium perfringens]